MTQLDWTPPGQGNTQVVQALDNIADSPLADKIAAANQQALERIIQSHPVLIGFDQAINVVPGMTPKNHSSRRAADHLGKNVRRDERRGHRSAGVRRTGERSRRGGDLGPPGRSLSPCHEHDCVGSMAGVTSASMFMHIVKNKTYGNIAYTNNERKQMAMILRMGANDQSVIDRLNWMRDAGTNTARRDENYRRNRSALMLAQALHMGDECHNRNNAGTTLLIQALTPGIIQAGYSVESNSAKCLSLSPAATTSPARRGWRCKAAMDAARHRIQHRGDHHGA